MRTNVTFHYPAEFVPVSEDEGILNDLYPGSHHVHPLGIVTKDVDFSDLCMLFGFPPKVIWIRRGNCKTMDIERLLRHHYADIEALDSDAVMGILTLF